VCLRKRNSVCVCVCVCVCVKKRDRQTGSLVYTKRICNLSDSKYILKFLSERGEKVLEA